MKKLNIVTNKPIFKQLPPINVNDSVLEVTTKPRKFKMNKENCSTADPEPVLQNFLKPSAPLKYEIPMDLDDDFKYERSPTMKKLANSCFRNLREEFSPYMEARQYFKFPRELWF